MLRIRLLVPVLALCLLMISAVATAAPMSGVAPSCSIALPDNQTTFTNDLTVYQSVVINDVNVVLDITHTWVGDLTITLKSPQNTTVTLVDRPGHPASGFGFGSDDIRTTLDDEAGGGPVEDANPPTGASYTPNQPLSSFDGENAKGTWTIGITDNARGDSGNLNTWSLVINGTSYTCTLAPAPETQETVWINEDPDGDGISGERDNCPNDYNPDQEDGWGSTMGDLCDTDWYNLSGQGIAGFVQKGGAFHLHGNCTYMPDGDPRCPVIAAFDPVTFAPGSMPLDVTSDQAGTWSIVIYYLHSNNGADVYQVNTYSTNPPKPDTLMDDRLEIHVYGSSWRWQMRGGSSSYQGATYGSGGSASGESKQG